MVAAPSVMTINFPPAKSWKTSVFGIITAFAAFVLFSPETFSQWPWVLQLAKFITVGGLAGMGLAGKDYDRTNTPPALTVESRAVPKYSPNAEPKQ